MSTANQRRVRRAVALALLLVLLLAGSTAAVAQWMARASNPANTFTAATLHLADSLEGNPILGGTVAPGTVLTGTVIITNGATMPVSITLSESAAAAHLAPGSTLAGALHLDVRECGPTSAHEIPLPADPQPNASNHLHLHSVQCICWDCQKARKVARCEQTRPC